MSALDTFLTRMRLGRALLDAVYAVVNDFLHPDTGGSREALVASLVSIGTAYQLPEEESMEYATIAADAVEALAGSQKSVDHVLDDLKKWLATKGHVLDPAEEGMVRDLLVRTEQAIADFRSGKSGG